MAGYKLISSDSHVVEPEGLWKERIAPEYRDRAPHLAHDETTDQWYADGIKFGIVVAGTLAGQRFEDPSKLTFEGRYEDTLLGGYDPHAHVTDMDADSIAGGVLYPSVALDAYSIPDTGLLSATLAAYNDWLADFCAPYPDRLRGVTMLNVDDVGEAVEELQRCAKKGLVGAMIPIKPSVHRYDHPMYEPLWAAAQDMEMPLSLHTGTFRWSKEGGWQLKTQMADAVEQTNREYHVRNAMGALILSGVFERFPKLRVGVVEFEIGWAPYFMNRLDDTYRDRPVGQTSYRFKGDALPSDFFRQNAFISFQEDDLGVEMRHHIGVENLLWGSDYPHPESTFPKSKEIVERILDGVPEEEAALIAGANTARLYRFN